MLLYIYFATMYSVLCAVALPKRMAANKVTADTRFPIASLPAIGELPSLS